LKLLIIYGLSLSAPLQADSLERLRDMLNRHPAIESAASSARARESGALTALLRYPDPMIEVSSQRGREDMLEILPEVGGDRRQVRGSEVVIRQPLPFPGRGTVASRLQSSMADEQNLRIRLLRNRMAREYLALLGRESLLLQRIAYTRQTRSQVQTVSELASIQYSAGKGSLVDVASAKVRENELSIALSDMQAELAGLVHERNYYETGGGAAIAPEALAAAWQLLSERVLTAAEHLEERSIDLQVAREGTRRADIGDTLARMEFLPDFELFTAYGSVTRRSSSFQESSRERMVRAGVNIRVPLWSALTNFPNISEKQHDLNSSRLDTQNMRARVSADLRASLERMKGLRQGIQLHRESLIPGAMSAHQAARISYASGKIPFREVVETLSGHLDHELSLVEHELLYQAELLKAAESLDAFFEAQK
jgi:cobalt-zinc-cadmium efflux system outer membrane protein